MKIDVHFNLDDGLDTYDYETFKDMHKYRHAVCALDEALRSRLKHGDLSPEVDKELQAVRDLMHECLDGAEV